MIDLIKKAMFTGVGFAALTKEKVEDVAKVFVEQGKLSRQEGEKLVDELLERSKESQQQLTKQVGEMVESAMEGMNLVSMKEIENLQEEIAELKKRIDELESDKTDKEES
ncbi:MULTISPECIES: phasin family protein [Desulfosediminicola]|uniref:phasin family protein n=1 Tax=Desulfosediminicola TaxID=2886823 RepID=UPI0010ACB7F3|nr:hypothetical protein [Desulfosediminicola ganghwensis]